MGRRPSTAGGRPVGINVRLSEAEAAVLDGLRGGLNRSEYLRWLLELAARTGMKAP